MKHEARMTKEARSTNVKKGRPEGAPNREYDLVASEPTRCGKCGSTERAPYSRTEETAYAGVDEQGRPYTHIVRRWTFCKACGQWRIDRSRENRAAEEPEKK